MFVSSKLTASGNPTAFVSSSLRKARVFNSDSAYEIDGFWVSPKKSSRQTRLAFGTILATFKGAGYENLSYTDFLQEARIQEDPSAVYHMDRKLCHVSWNAKIIWEPTAVWCQDGFRDLEKNLRTLMDAYPLLPAIPAGTDGWYKLRK